MQTDLIQFLLDFIGIYTIPTYTVTENIVTADPINGGFNTLEWTYEVIPNGLAGLDIQYITRFILLMFVLTILYNTIKWSFQLLDKSINRSNRGIKFK